MSYESEQLLLRRIVELESRVEQLEENAAKAMAGSVTITLGPYAPPLDTAKISALLCAALK